MLIYVHSCRDLPETEIESVRAAACSEQPEKAVKHVLPDVENVIREDGEITVIVGKPPHCVKYETDVKTRRM